MRIAIEQQSQVHRKVCTFPRTLRAYNNKIYLFNAYMRFAT